MLRLIIQHIHFTRTERLGVVVLLLLCLLVYVLPAFMQAPVRNTDFSAFQTAIRQYRQTSPDSVPQAPKKLFAFDPNTADETAFAQLGLSEKTIHSIVHYREKGGQFRQPDDFEKIYTLDPDDFDRLKPYIRIAHKEQAQFVHYNDDAPPSYRERPTWPQKRKSPIDINRSSLEDWVQLPGIGEKRAAQILHFRESLGGFLSVVQVGETFNLPDSVFQLIQPYLLHESDGIKKINLNSAFSEDLDRHPYISEKQAKLIVRYREQHGPYQSVEDLKNIIAFKDPVWLEKVKPYLGVE